MAEPTGDKEEIKTAWLKRCEGAPEEYFDTDGNELEHLYNVFASGWAEGERYTKEFAMDTYDGAADDDLDDVIYAWKWGLLSYCQKHLKYYNDAL